MSTFPTIKTLTGLSIKIIKPAVRKTTAAGYTVSFCRATVPKKEIIADYSGVTSADRLVVDTFFENNQGGSFDLSNPDPDDASIYVVGFGQDSIDWKYEKDQVGRWSTQIKFLEV